MRALFLIGLIGLWALPLQAASNKSHPDKPIGSYKASGKFLKFEQGDYLHASFKTSKGKELTFFVDTPEACFLAIHKAKPMNVEYNSVKRFIPEANDYYPVDYITQIEVKGADFKTWKKSFRKKDIDKCEKLIDKYF